MKPIENFLLDSLIFKGWTHELMKSHSFSEAQNLLNGSSFISVLKNEYPHTSFEEVYQKLLTKL